MVGCNIFETKTFLVEEVKLSIWCGLNDLYYVSAQYPSQPGFSPQPANAYTMQPTNQMPATQPANQLAAGTPFVQSGAYNSVPSQPTIFTTTQGVPLTQSAIYHPGNKQMN